MVIKKPLTPTTVVDVALGVVDEDGPDGLTLAAVAQRCGVATPSLYKHVASLGELKTLVGVRVLEDMTEQFTAAVLGSSGDEAVTTLMHAYRAYVAANPNRYAAMPMDPVHDPVQRAIAGKLLGVMYATLRGYGLEGPAAVHATRRLRVLVHGFASIESAGGFGLPEDLDETYDQLIQMYLTTLRNES
ncbi:WHG domain-containing protein [Kribbella sp. NPDC026611]|uniref:TetR/AcrR family transcriptional regulator n=1 Tax=Kribbella sp. NPDC026611 TaxID=3154911 RepID=UPI0033E197D3